MKTKRELKTIITEEWRNINAEITKKKRMKSIPRRLKAVVDTKRYRTKLRKNTTIVRVQYFVRGGSVGHRSRASSKHLSSSSSSRRARFLGGQKGVVLHLQAARVGVRSTKKPTRC
ncbi:hypothetical protein TNCV_1706541 [Trichonephila clavipes]|uniref:Uncharacterized protein n=1 Tax=Trichonephila clavipes TaxID=2585209 RepID=A0A8X6RCB8_TRICX|nr:hypothetical protein TNCV_1706541 [Trichonephila clavipes]